MFKKTVMARFREIRIMVDGGRRLGQKDEGCNVREREK
jgi:hypothetical protein